MMQLNHCAVAKYFHDKICKIAKKYKIRLFDLEREFQINATVDCACDFCDIKEEEDDEFPDNIDYPTDDVDDDDEYEEIECKKIEIAGQTYLLDICNDAIYEFEYPHNRVYTLTLKNRSQV